MTFEELADPQADPHSAVESNNPRRRHVGTLAIVQGAVAVAAYYAVAIIRGVNNTWDQQHYHLVVGWSALRGRLVAPDWIVAGSVSFFNPILDTVFAFFYLQSPWLGHLVIAIPGLLACVAARWLLADLLPDRMRRGWRSWLLVAAALLSVLGADALGQIGGSMGDLTLAMPVVFGALLVQRSLTGRTARPERSMLVGCMLLGATMGLKVTLIPVSVGFVIAAAVGANLVRRRRHIGHDVERDLDDHVARAGIGDRHTLAGWGIGWGVTGLPWALFLWMRFDNPIFPFMNDLFKSRWASTASWGTPYHVGGLDYLLMPIRIAVSQARHDVSPYRLLEPRFLVGLVGALIGLAALAWRRRDVQRSSGNVSSPTIVFLCGGWLLSYLMWAVTLANARYTIPLLALAAPSLVCGVRALSPMLPRLPRRSAEFLAVFVVAVLGAGSAIALGTGVPEWGPRTTNPQKAWEFPDGPQSDLRNPILTDWKGRDVVMSTFPWPLGFMSIELEPARVWNLREGMTITTEATRFEDFMVEVIDRTGSLVVYDPRFDDATSIVKKLGRVLGEPVIIRSSAIFANGWTPAEVCEWASAASESASG